MEIGIIGSGVVGQQLGLGLLKLGHEVKIGTRNPQKLDEWLKTAGNGASVGSFREAAQFGAVIILATLWEGSADAIALAGPEHFSGKIVLDVTNPLDFSKGAPPRLDSAPGKSGAERIHEHIPNAKLAKAFNHISAHIMISPAREEGVPDLFVAGDPEAKAFATEIALAWGWNSVVDMGDLSQAYLLEAYAMLWIQYAFTTGTWIHAFKFLRK